LSMGREVHTPLFSWSLLLFVLLLVPDSPLAQPLYVLETRNLTVLYEESVKGGAEEAAGLYQEVRDRVEKKLGLQVAFAPSILLIKDTEKFRKAAGSALVVAFAVPEKNLMVIDYSRIRISPLSLAVTMKHELSHLLIHQHLGGRRVPRWFDEGIAQWVSEGIGEIIIEQKKSPLNEAVLAGRIFPMRALAESFPADGESLSLAYEQSRSFVTYIIEMHGLGKVMNILDGVKESRSWEEAVRDVLDVSFADLEYMWRDDLKKKLTWFTYVVNNLYEILFFLAALASVAGFIRAYLRKRAYMREEEEKTVISDQ